MTFVTVVLAAAPAVAQRADDPPPWVQIKDGRPVFVEDGTQPAQPQVDAVQIWASEKRRAWFRAWTQTQEAIARVKEAAAAAERARIERDRARAEAKRLRAAGSPDELPAAQAAAREAENERRAREAELRNARDEALRLGGTAVAAEREALLAEPVEVAAADPARRR